MTYKLSVIITCYNQIEYIEQAVESVLNQEIKYPYEILIGDDGSDDGSYEFIVKKWSKYEHVRIFRQERDNRIKEFPNWRHSRLIIRLMKEVKGEYFSVLDGDDFYCDKYGFQRKIAILDRHNNFDCVFCYSNMKKLLPNGEEIILVHENLKKKKNLYRSWFSKGRDPYLSLATAVIRSNIIGFLDERYTIEFADDDVLLWAMNYGLRYYDPHVTFVYRIHEDSIYNGCSDVLKAFRRVFSWDRYNIQWSYKWKKEILKFHTKRDIIYLYNNRNELKNLMDVGLWFSAVKEYQGWAFEILNWREANMSRRFWLWIRVSCLKISEELKLLPPIFKWWLFILNPINSVDEKINKIKRAFRFLNYRRGHL